METPKPKKIIQLKENGILYEYQYRWVEGHWRHTRRGWLNISGHWRFCKRIVKN